ncbi:MAG: nucleotidyltransferase domain-containing protein [Clostridia bacterium]|nr:nucleotidyltransferase domain-containing protein [Clostridia bacterium]
MTDLIALLKKEFGQRLIYVGLQGSHLRGEAREDSDIDVMVVFDRITTETLDAYRRVFSTLAEAEKLCGFVCEKDDLAHWNPMEICHVLHSTKDYYGTLAQLVPSHEKSDVINYIKMSVGNVYHEMCHRYLHAGEEKNAQDLPYTYRNVFFILQNIYYLEDGAFYPTKKELLSHLQDADRPVMETMMTLSDGRPYDFGEAFRLLLAWCQDVLKRL